MLNETLFQTFQKCYQDTDLTPLVELEQLERFGVEYGTEALEEVLQLVEDNAAQDAKVIFSGHRGCGKSTLLAKVGRQMSDRYFVAFFSISDSIEMSDVNHVNILFAIIINLMLEAEKQQIKISESVKNSFYNWIAEHVGIEIETPISTEISVEINLFNLIRRKLKFESVSREEIKQEFAGNFLEPIIEKLNEIATLIRVNSQKKVLVIIDDMDKLNPDAIYNIFQYNIKTLIQPNFNIIFGIPLTALQDHSLRLKLVNELNGNLVVMPTAKLFKKGENFNLVVQEDIVNILCQMLYRRIPASLLDSGIANQIVIKSGGLLRELVRIANRCCRICLRKIRQDSDAIEIKINQEVLDEAIKDLRLDIEVTLGKRDYDILINIHNNFLPKDSTDQTFLDLLHSSCILEYRNLETWYYVHPVIQDILEIKGFI
jgi:KAP family P-loop domain